MNKKPAIRVSDWSQPIKICLMVGFFGLALGIGLAILQRLDQIIALLS